MLHLSTMQRGVMCIEARLEGSLTRCACSQMGFFAEAGPVQIFVSSHLIPDDFDYFALDDPCFVSEDEEVRSHDKEPLMLKR